MNLAVIDGKIEEVASALKLTIAFEAELHDSGGNSGNYVHRMVVELEERLDALRSMRRSTLARPVSSLS